MKKFILSAACCFLSSSSFAFDIAAGGSHNLVVGDDGSFVGWGYNAFGQLGDGTNSTKYAPIPLDLAGTSALFAGNSNSFAMTQSGNLYAWGHNRQGQLGLGHTDEVVAPTLLGLTGIDHIGAGDLHALAVTLEGGVLAWGNNNDGRLGNGTTLDSLQPVSVQGLTDIHQVAAGHFHSLALSQQGHVYAWGSNTFGYLGDGTTFRRLQPVLVSDLNDVTHIDAGTHHSVAVKADGTVWSWGWNYYGQLGNGTTSGSALRPIQTRDLTDIVAVSAGERHSLALQNNGSVWAWGDNSYGQLGDGSFTDAVTPVQVALPGKAIDVQAGQFHSLVLMGNGEVLAFGRNYRGQIGQGNLTNAEAVPTLASTINVSAPLGSGTTCHTIKQNNPDSQSGIYWIDPDGENGLAPFEAYCEMQRMGGGWTLYANHRNNIEQTQITPLVTPSVYGVMDDAQWQSTLASMSVGMLFVDEHGGESHLSAAKLNAGNCRTPGSIASLASISLVGGYQSIWHHEISGCGVFGRDYSMVILVDKSNASYTYQGAELTNESIVGFDVWAYGSDTYSGGHQDELLYYVK